MSAVGMNAACLHMQLTKLFLLRPTVMMNMGLLTYELCNTQLSCHQFDYVLQISVVLANCYVPNASHGNKVQP
jgi:hypothetical protein